MAPADPEKTPVNVKPDKIARFLQQTGYVFEMRAHELLRQLGYKCEVGDAFLDLDGDVERELDIVASKTINEITISFVIECKQSVNLESEPSQSPGWCSATELLHKSPPPTTSRATISRPSDPKALEQCAS